MLPVLPDVKPVNHCLNSGNLKRNYPGFDSFKVCLPALALNVLLTTYQLFYINAVIYLLELKDDNSFEHHFKFKDFVLILFLLMIK